jgi:predicted dehydrogenase
MINLGIVGLGPVWENRYRPVLEKLRHRIRIRAVFDPVASRCEAVAIDFGATPFQGVLSLLRDADVRGVLVLDTSWHGNELLHFLRVAKKPAYIAGSLGEDWDEISRLRILVESEGLLVMPEFSRRFTPATCRLHELIATRLGRPQRIAIDAAHPSPDAPNVIPGQAAGTDFLVGLLDWCRYVLRSATVRVESRAIASDMPQDEDHRAITIEFSESRDPQRRQVAELLLRSATSQAQQFAAEASPLRFTIHCENGEATIEGPVHIRWSVTGNETVTELLTADRSEVEVMIDHFCRRLVGGLVPIADISDICRCLHLVKAASRSHSTGEPIHFNGDLA